MGKFVFDEAKWPIVLVKYPPEYDADAWAEFGDYFIGRCKAGKPFVMINDARQARPPSVQQRKQVSDNLRANEDAVRTGCAGNIVVVSSALVRGAATAINWVRPPPCPYKFVGTVEEAMVVAHELLHAAGVATPGAQPT